MIHGFRLSPGTAVGALVLGIVLGWLHSIRPSFGRVPEAASALPPTAPPQFVHLTESSGT